MSRLRPSDPIAKALASFRAIVADIEERADLEELKDADGALWDVAHERKLHKSAKGRPTPLGPEPDTFEVEIPPPAIGSWRLDQL
jgi:hypothetical protein